MENSKATVMTIQIPQFENPVWEEIGYEPKTTFWQDFSIADHMGDTKMRLEAVQDTYKRAFAEWKNNIVYLTELALVLNHKSWQWYNKNNEIGMLYATLYYEVDDWAHENLSEKDMDYYFSVTD